MRERSDYSVAITGSVVFHLGLFALVLFARPWARDLPVGTVVPINIVANAPVTDLRAAAVADEVQTAQSEMPAESPPIEPPVPAPAPTPEKEAPTPKPAPAPTAKPLPSIPMPSKPLDLDALAASIAKTTKPSAAKKGPARTETALIARDAAGAGQGVSASAMAGLADELQRRWNPNCEVEGGRDVRIRVIFKLGQGGQLLGPVEAGGQETSSNPVVRAAAERAIRAVHQAAPFLSLPHDFFGQLIAVNFNAREACG